MALQCLEEWRWNNTRREQRAVVRAKGEAEPMVVMTGLATEAATDEKKKSAKYIGIDWSYYAVIKKFLWKKEPPCGLY